MVARQHMDDQRLLGHFERNDMLERSVVGLIVMVLIPVILDCMRPSKAPLPFGWTRVLGGEGHR